MSDMPERILAWREEDEYIDHVLINKCWGETSEVPSWDATEYIRADLMAELVEALRWYGEVGRLARLITREGDAGRAAISADGGQRAARALAAIARMGAGDGLAASNALIDLIGELGREVHYLIDGCETSGDKGDEVHTIEGQNLERVSALLDQIEALPFEEPGVILGPGAMLQAALKQTFLAHIAALTLERDQAVATAECDHALLVAAEAERDALRERVARLEEHYSASEAITSIEAEWRSRKADGLLDGSNIFNLTDKLTAAEARLSKARAARFPAIAGGVVRQAFDQCPAFSAILAGIKRCGFCGGDDVEPPTRGPRR